MWRPAVGAAEVIERREGWRGNGSRIKASRRQKAVRTARTHDYQSPSGGSGSGSLQDLKLGEFQRRGMHSNRLLPQRGVVKRIIKESQASQSDERAARGDGRFEFKRHSGRRRFR